MLLIPKVSIPSEQRGVWDLNFLEVAAKHMLQAAILFLTKTVGKNVLMSVGGK